FAEVGDVPGREDDVFELAAEGLDGGADDGERAARLRGEGRGVRAVGVDSYGSGDGDEVAAANGAGVAHLRLPLGAGAGTSPAGTIADHDLNVVGHCGPP